MMIERILLLVTDTPAMAATAAWTLGLARDLSARLFAIAMLGPADLPADEERAWKLLYEIEDDAFEQNVKVSLLLEAGAPLDRLPTLAANYEVGLVVASADCQLDPAELVRRSPRPVVIYNKQPEV